MLTKLGKAFSCGLVLLCAGAVISLFSARYCCAAGPLQSSGDARTSAQALLGHPSLDGAAIADKATVDILTMNDTTTPFLGEYATGRRVWKVEYHNIPLFPGKDGRPDSRKCNIAVFLDSLEGHALKVECYLEDLIPDVDILVPAKEAERQLLYNGEAYIGFPNRDSLVTFFEALQVCSRDPISARRISGQLVLLRKGRVTDPGRPVWVVQLQGIPPISFYGGPTPNIPVYQKNHSRQIINAVSGRLSFTALSPQPLRKQNGSSQPPIAEPDSDTGDGNE